MRGAFVTEVNLSKNNLKGGISAIVGQLVGLEKLNLSQNAVEGAIPPEIGLLANLQVLNLSDNRLRGSLPEELGSLKRLKSLNIRNNIDLCGDVPFALGGMVSLRDLGIAGTSLTDGNGVFTIGRKWLVLQEWQPQPPLARFLYHPTSAREIEESLALAAAAELIYDLCKSKLFHLAKFLRHEKRLEEVVWLYRYGLANDFNRLSNRLSEAAVASLKFEGGNFLHAVMQCTGRYPQAAKHAIRLIAAAPARDASSYAYLTDGAGPQHDEVAEAKEPSGGGGGGSSEESKREEAVFRAMAAADASRRLQEARDLKALFYRSIVWASLNNSDVVPEEDGTEECAAAATRLFKRLATAQGIEGYAHLQPFDFTMAERTGAATAPIDAEELSAISQVAGDCEAFDEHLEQNSSFGIFLIFLLEAQVAFNWCGNKRAAALRCMQPRRELLRTVIQHSLVTLAALIVLGVQIYIPTALLMAKTTKAEHIGWWCPFDGQDGVAFLDRPVLWRLTAFFIALLYFGRFLLVFTEKSSRGGRQERAQELFSGSVLGSLGGLDDVLDIEYEGLVSIINLRVILTGETVLDMIINSLALEFVMQLDDGFKAVYMAIFCSEVRQYVSSIGWLPSITSLHERERKSSWWYGATVRGGKFLELVHAFFFAFYELYLVATCAIIWSNACGVHSTYGGL